MRGVVGGRVLLSGMKTSVAWCVVVAAAWGSSAAGQVEYVIDDGRGNSTGVAFDEWDFVFVNAFTPEPGGEWIAGVSVCWGSAMGGIPAEIVLLDDPDGDGSPAAARVRAVAAAATNPRGNGVFEFVAFDRPRRVCSAFFVGVRIRRASGGLGVNPARLDPEGRASADRAYLAFGSVVNPELALDIERLGEAPVFRRMDANAIPGVWLVRARGVADAGCAADFNGDGFGDFFDYAEFVACFEGEACPACRDADVNGDGFADFFDYEAFVAAFEAGC
jgi:hypothetical protein